MQYINFSAANRLFIPPRFLLTYFLYFRTHSLSYPGSNQNQPSVSATFQKLSHKMPAELYKSLTWDRGTEHLELSSSELGVQTISQPIPTEINREHREHDRHPWEGHDPPGERYVGAAVCNHITPARSGLRNSYP